MLNECIEYKVHKLLLPKENLQNSLKNITRSQSENHVSNEWRKGRLSNNITFLQEPIEPKTKCMVWIRPPYDVLVGFPSPRWFEHTTVLLQYLSYFSLLASFTPSLVHLQAPADKISFVYCYSQFALQFFVVTVTPNITMPQCATPYQLLFEIQLFS